MLNQQIIKRKAFTLAEVLITLGIIGVVAAMTIPTVINNAQDAQYKTAYKKAFSIASQALTSEITEEATVIISEDTTFQIFLGFMNQFKTLKQCTTGNTFECWDVNGELFGKDYSSGMPIAGFPAFIDTSGFAWVNISDFEGRFAVDTNGFKKPNQYGKDRFILNFADSNNTTAGTAIKIQPWSDNNGNTCYDNTCGTLNNYFGTSWLYN